MTRLSQYRNCSTHGLHNLDQQLIRQIQRIAPGVLTSFAHLPRVTLGAGCHAYLQTPAVAALKKVIEARPNKILKVNSAYRTLAQQSILFNHFLSKRCSISAAARPGSSNHESGLALDIEDYFGWRPFLEVYGWDWIGSFDQMHFDFEGSGTKDLRWISIKAFQQLHNFNNPQARIAEDGIWGITTQLALANTPIAGFRTLPGNFENISDNLAARPKKVFQPLREGQSGAVVSVLQGALTRKGYKLEADNYFGSATLKAVKAFQLANGLVADGVVGMATWATLDV